MRARTWWKVWLTTSAFLAASAAEAQDRIATRADLMRECRADSAVQRTADELGPAVFALKPSERERTMLDARRNHAYVALGDSVLATWIALSAGIDLPTAARMRVLVDSQRFEMALLENNETFKRTRGATVRWFQLQERPGEARWTLNPADADAAVHLTPGESTVATVRAVCWTALLARSVAEFAGQKARDSTRVVLMNRARRWDNFERTGYSMMPLELLINGWCGPCRSELEPPAVQIIAMHLLPTYAVRDSIGSRAALTTEIAGLLFYNSSRSSHWGVSYAWSLPTEERPESGFVLHVSSVGQLGLSFRDHTLRRDRASVLLSADLYDLVGSWRERFRDERDKVREELARFGVK